jgi:hypothetical protein
MFLLLAVPFANTLFLILVVSLIFLVIYLIVKSIEFPPPWKQYAMWFVAGLWILFLLWQALQISGLL